METAPTPLALALALSPLLPIRAPEFGTATLTLGLQLRLPDGPAIAPEDPLLRAFGATVVALAAEPADREALQAAAFAGPAARAHPRGRRRGRRPGGRRVGRGRDASRRLPAVPRGGHGRGGPRAGPRCRGARAGGAAAARGRPAGRPVAARPRPRARADQRPPRGG